MELWKDGLIAFFAAAGVAAVFWMLAGWILRLRRRQLRRAVLLLAVKGREVDLADQVRQLQEARCAMETAPRIVLVDCGMDDETARQAQRLAAGQMDFAVYPKEEIGALLEELTK